jgi:hypothetical protein
MDGNRQESWPTPTALNRVRDEETMEKCLKFRQGNGQTSVPLYLEEKVNLEEKKSWATGKLNPRWVETLMGLPIGWTMPSCASPVTTVQTSYDCLETELSQQQQNEHSELF